MTKLIQDGGVTFMASSATTVDELKEYYKRMGDSAYDTIN